MAPGLYGLPHFAAGAVNVIPESGHFEPAEIFELLDHWPNASFFAAPTMLVRLMASPAARTPRNLKTITYGGAPMYVADCLRAIELFGPRLFQLLGPGRSADDDHRPAPVEFHRLKRTISKPAATRAPVSK